MKKYKFISAIALTMMLGACENFDLPNPDGQTYDEPDAIFEGADLVISAPASTSINLVALNEANVDAEVADITTLENFPAEYSLSVDMELSASSDYSKSTTISTTVVDNSKIEVNPDVLNGAIQTVKTKEPGTYTIYARYAAYAELGNTRMRLGGLDTYYGAETLTITTLNAEKAIEEMYYLVPCSSDGTPNLSGALAMNNTAGAGVSQYDNPEFALKIDVSESQAAAGYKWMIAPLSSISAGSTSGLYGCNPSSASDLAGKLGTDYSAGVITINGPLLITINMEVDSYSISYALDNLYPATATYVNKLSQVMMLYTNDYIEYTGVSLLSKRWYLYGDTEKSTQFLQDEELGYEDSEDGLTRSGYLTSTSDGGSLTTDFTNQLFWCNVNLVQLTYSVTCLETISVIGSGNGWDLGTATELKASSDKKTWTASDVAIGDEFKLNCNGAWDIDFGGSATKNEVTGGYSGELSYKGSNIQIEAGTYDVTVDFSAQPYVITLTKK